MSRAEPEEAEKGALKGLGARAGWCTAGLGLKVTLTGIVVLGVVLRVAQWAHNRELWYDEAYLALDLASKSYAQLLGPLSWNMNYPIAFLLSTRFVTNCCGLSEYALRLLPLIAGLVTLPIFMWLTWRVTRPSAESSNRGGVPTIVIAALMFAVSKHHIYYSSELRHYSIDVLAACVLYLIAVPSSPKPVRLRRMALLSLVGAAAIWFSITSIFVLAAIATVDMISHVSTRQWRRAVWIAGCCVPWGLSFLAHLQWLRLNTLMRGVGPQIEAVCASMSVPLFPTSGVALRTYRDALEHVFSFPGGFTYAGLAGFAFLLGCIAMWGSRRGVLLKLILPFVYTMAASSFHQYPFRNQYLLFLLPCLYLVVAEGIGAFFVEASSVRWRFAGLVLAVMLLAQPTVHGLKVLQHPRSGPGGASEIKPLLAHVREQWRDGDVLYVCGDQRITFAYYGPRCGFQAFTPSRDAAPGIAIKQAYTLAPAMASSATTREAPLRFWLLYQGHEKLEPGTGLSSTAGKGQAEIEALRSESSSLYLYAIDGNERK